MTWRAGIERRPLLAGLVGALGLGILGGGAYEAARILHRNEKAGAYGDLVSRLPDPDGARLLGHAVIAGLPRFNAAETARSLRKALAIHSLADVTASDLAAGRVAEAGGWVLPESLALICALAAAAA